MSLRGGTYSFRRSNPLLSGDCFGKEQGRLAATSELKHAGRTIKFGPLAPLKLIAKNIYFIADTTRAMTASSKAASTRPSNFASTIVLTFWMISASETVARGNAATKLTDWL
jgi:hypothetical protein